MLLRCLASVAFTVSVSLSAQTGGTSLGVRQPHATTNSPITLVLETKSVQTLPDGTHITNVSRETFIRDSQGRTRQEHENMTPPASITLPMAHTVSVADPVAQERFSWTADVTDERQKVFTKTQMSGAYQVPTPRPATVAAQSAGTTPLLRMAPPPQTSQRVMPEVKREDLGLQSVEGETCQASRVTRVYPVGFLNNDRPLTEVQEFCMSRDLGRNLTEKIEDPRFGIRTMTVVSLSRAEPDAQLFQPPADYTERVARPANTDVARP